MGAETQQVKTAVQVNQPLGRFATALRRHDMFFAWSDDGRVFKRGCEEREALLSMSRDLERADVLVLVELEARKRLPDPKEWQVYVEQFEYEMEHPR